MNEMVVYEVTAMVEPEKCEGYERYMIDEHIPDLLSTGYFESASLERSDPGRYQIRYLASTREQLDRYLAEHAPRLRKDFFEHFPDGVELTREEWSVLKRFA